MLEDTSPRSGRSTVDCRLSTRPEGPLHWDVVARWPDGWCLRRLENQGSGRSWKRLLTFRIERGSEFMVVVHEQNTQSGMSEVFSVRSVLPSSARWLQEMTSARGRLLWFFRTTGLEAPTQASSGAPFHLLRCDKEAIRLDVPGRFPDPEINWLRDVPGFPSTPEEADALLVETLPGRLPSRGRLETLEFRRKIVRRKREEVAFTGWVGGSTFQRGSPLVGLFPHHFQISAVREVRGSLPGDLHRFRVGIPPKKIRISPGDAPATLGGAIREYLVRQGYLEPAAWDAWMGKNEIPGILAIGEDELDVIRILGNPNPLLLPYDEFMRWAMERD